MAQENGKEINALDVFGGFLFNPEISLGKRADNFVRSIANGITFGLADGFAGAMNKATPKSLAKLLNTTSCQSKILLCIDEEIQRSEQVRNETPLEYFGGIYIGTILGPKAIPGLSVPREPYSKYEHAAALVLLNLYVNYYFKPKIANSIVFDPHTPEEQITAPSFKNLAKELTGQKAPPVTQR